MAKLHLFFPQGLWLALTLPAVLALYILRPRHKKKIVPSTLLWEQVSLPRQATRPWQKLRPQLLLWLQLLAAALFSLGAAAPVWDLERPFPDTIVLLDASASMQATDLEQTRFEAARAEIEKIATGLEKGTRLTVIAFDRQPRVVVNECGDPNEIRRLLKELEPSFLSAELEPALSLARAMARRQKSPPRLVLLSDGVEAGLAEEETALELRLVGTSQASNAALASLQLRPSAGDQAALATVANTGARPVSGKVQLTAGGRPQTAKAFQLAPQESSSLLWPGLPAGVAVEARLEFDAASKDHLALDNRAWAVPKEEQTAKILLVTPGNLFLEKVLSVLPQFEVYKVEPEKYAFLLAGDYPYHLTVLDGLAGPFPPGPVFLINPPPGELFSGLSAGEILAGELQPETDSPLTKHVDLSQVHVAAARALETKGGWTKDVTSEGKVVLAHGSEQGRRAVVLGFALFASDLPLRPAFPVLIQNILSWLLPPGLGIPAQVAPGEEVRVNILPQAQEITVENMEEDTSVTLAPPFPPLSWRPEKPGLYRLTQTMENGQGGVSRMSCLLAVNGYNQAEANISVSYAAPGTAGAAPEPAPHPEPRPFARWLALLALLIVLLEWGVASRGS